PPPRFIQLDNDNLRRTGYPARIFHDDHEIPIIPLSTSSISREAPTYSSTCLPLKKSLCLKLSASSVFTSSFPKRLIVSSWPCAQKECQTIGMKREQAIRDICLRVVIAPNIDLRRFISAHSPLNECSFSGELYCNEYDPAIGRVKKAFYPDALSGSSNDLIESSSAPFIISRHSRPCASRKGESARLLPILPKALTAPSRARTALSLSNSIK